MRQLVLGPLLLVLGLALASCRRGGSPKLEGHWKGQKADGVPESAQVAANAFATGTDIIAQGDQIAIQTPAGRNPAARYVVDKEDATTVVIHTERDGIAETFTFNETGDVMIWKIDAQKSITFRKVP